MYPLTIVYDRYSGVYSRGTFTAWPLESYNVPDAIHQDDVSCWDFWDVAPREYIGFGRTPDEAYQDLLDKFKATGKSEWDFTNEAFFALADYITPLV